MFAHTPEGAEINVEVERLIGSHLCIVGNSGSGKSQTIRKLLEVTWGRLPHIVLDVEDEFHTLRERFPYALMGGAYGDIPITIEDAPALAEGLIRDGTSAVIQLNDLDLEDRRHFIKAFLEALIALPRELWRPALIVLDEADRYAPQAGGAVSLASITALMAQGRKRGFTGVLATQRFAKLNKNAIGDVNNWMIGRVGQSTDRRVATDALGFGQRSAEASGLRTLKPGQFWMFGPAHSSQPTLCQVGQPVTTHLQLGQQINWKPKARPERRPAPAPGWSSDTVANVITGLIVWIPILIGLAIFFPKVAIACLLVGIGMLLWKRRGRNAVSIDSAGGSA